MSRLHWHQHLNNQELVQNILNKIYTNQKLPMIAPTVFDKIQTDQAIYAQQCDFKN